MKRFSVLIAACLALAACDNSQPKQPAAGQSPPVRTACTTPEQAGLKAQDITNKLVEARKQGKITPDQYVVFNNTMSDGFRAWAERQDLKAYCAALNRVVTDAGL
ncbi:MAG: hypothetical protein KBA31_04360 [Alphaproteobacteria bacterium]|nr:hypothetical protein [Alphaproteobacteria bacterium]